MEEEYITKLGRYMVEEIRQCSNAGVVTETEDGWEAVFPTEPLVFHDHPVGALLDNITSIDTPASREDYELMEEITEQMEVGETHHFSQILDVDLDSKDMPYNSVHVNVEYVLIKDRYGLQVGRDERVQLLPPPPDADGVYTTTAWACIGC